MEQSSTRVEEASKPAVARAERRRHPRYVCEGFVEAIVNEAEFLFRGEIHDLSRSGCFIRTRARLRVQPGQQVDLFFTIQNDQIKCQARVANLHAGKGVGLEFIVVSERAQKTIRALVRRFEELQKEALDK